MLELSQIDGRERPAAPDHAGRSHWVHGRQTNMARHRHDNNWSSFRDRRTAGVRSLQGEVRPQSKRQSGTIHSIGPLVASEG